MVVGLPATYGAGRARSSVPSPSVRRGGDYDIDLLVESPPGASSCGFVAFKALIEKVLGRPVDLVDYGA